MTKLQVPSSANTNTLTAEVGQLGGEPADVEAIEDLPCSVPEPIGKQGFASSLLHQNGPHKLQRRVKDLVKLKLATLFLSR